ncbi:unnamed protein product [Rotaria sp. Silwood2]|nr:unnamed protein product [Rotaria sp. Silwood2]
MFGFVISHVAHSFIDHWDFAFQVRTAENSNEGTSIKVEVWEMPLSSFGAFTAQIPSPLSIGKIILKDGSQIPGCVCESYAIHNAVDITPLRSWRAFVKDNVV